jgi:hypothetical protein
VPLGWGCGRTSEKVGILSQDSLDLLWGMVLKSIFDMICGLGFFGGFFCSWVLGFIRVLLLFGCLMGLSLLWVLGLLKVLGVVGFWGF